MQTKIKPSLLLNACVAGLLLAGCNAGTTNPPASQQSSDNSVKLSTSYIYTAAADKIAVFRIESDNRLTQIESVDTGGIGARTPLTFSQSGRSAYMVNSDGNDITTFIVNPYSGRLTKLNSSTPTGLNPYSLVVDADDKCAYVSNFRESSISTYAISESNGSLTPLTKIQTGAVGPEQLTFFKNGKFAYIANFDRLSTKSTTIGSVAQFGVNPGCVLAPLSPATVSTQPASGAGSNPSTITIDPSGKYLYASNYFSDQESSSIAVFKIDQANGTLSAQQPVPVARDPKTLVFDRSGKYAYIENNYSPDGKVNNYQQRVSMFSFNPASGELNPIGPGYVSNDTVVKYFDNYSFSLNPSDKFAYMPNPSYNTISAFSIAADGSLTLINNKFATGTTPSAVVYSPDGKALYVLNRNSASISPFSIESDGSLTPLGESLPTATLPTKATPRFATVKTYTVDTKLNK